MAIYIKNEAQLRAYASNPTDDAILLSNIALKEGDWTPIVNMAYSFDGQGHTITNVNVNSTASTPTGFIANTYAIADGLIIKNLRISGDIRTTGTSAGGIVGAQASTNTQIINCKFTGTVTAKNRVGGIVGRILGSADGLIVARNQVDGDIRATEDISKGYAGGIIGYAGIPELICQDNCFYGTLRSGTTHMAGIGHTVGGIVVACVARATQVSDTGDYTKSYGIASSPSHFVDNHYNSTLFGVHGPGDESTAEFTEISTYQAFGYYDFGTTWKPTGDGPKLIAVADYTFVQKFTPAPVSVPSTQPTILKFHATKAGDITPTLTFTGGPIEVFTETSQVGPVTNYTSQGTFVSGTPKTISLTLGQRLYFAIPTGTSITALDFTDDQITGTLDSEAIQTFATITLTNSGWRRYYIEKTLEYLDTAGFTGTLTATGTPGIFTDEALTARTNILARATSVVEVNLAQKGAGTYTFTLPFRTDVANRVFCVRIARNNATYITSAVCVIKDEEGNTLYTLDPGAVSNNTFTFNQTIPAIGNYTANYTVVLNPTGLSTDTASFIVTAPNTVIHTFDIKNVPIPVATSSFYVAYSAKNEIEGDISDCSEIIPGGRLAVHQFYPHLLPTLVGDIGTIRGRYVYQLSHCVNCYGNIENIDWGIEGAQPYMIGFNNMPKLVGDVDALKNLNYTVNNAGAIGFFACQGVHGSIENWKSASVDIRGSSNITGPINSVVSNYVASAKQVYGSGFTLEQLEESIDRLYNCGFVYKGSFIARGTGYGPELATSNQTTIDQIESLKAGGANIQVKTIAAVYDFTLAYHGAEAGDVYWVTITPTTPFTDYKITFPAGAFVRADNGNPVTEWTENMSPNVVCVTPGDYDIRWQFGWDGVSAYAIFNLASAPIASRSKHAFDISQIPDACHTRAVDLNAATNVTGDVSKFSNVSEGIGLYGTQNLSGSIASLTQQTFMSLDLRNSSLGGVVAGGAANCAYYFDNSKLTKSDIAKSLIYLNNRDPLYTGNFWCSGNMPAITDKKGIEAYDALVARLGETKIRVNVDREGGTVPVVSSNRLRPSSLARLQGMRRF